MRKPILITGKPRTGKTIHFNKFLTNYSKKTIVLDSFEAFETLPFQTILNKKIVFGIDGISHLRHLKQLSVLVNNYNFDFILTTQIDEKEFSNEIRAMFEIINLNKMEDYFLAKKPYERYPTLSLKSQFSI